MNRILSVATIILTLICNLNAQKGTIRGQVTDGTNGETLPFANVYVEDNTSKGTTTDLDGNYTLKLEPGTYKIVYSFASFAKQIKEVTIASGKTEIINVSMQDNNQLQAVTVKVDRGTPKSEIAFINEKMNSMDTKDGTTSDQMTARGDSDAGETIKRVTGVSVEGGKHVYVRGLGDRYTKTILNSMEIPGLDPNRNTVQMDIFPTNLIDNITVYKTFSPDLPGDYTGGLVNILTKDFPTTKTISFSAGYGYNSITTFNPDFILYNKGKFDFLGFDDGTRRLPVSSTKIFPDPTLNDEELTSLTQSFHPEMAVSQSTALMNQSYAFGIGNQINFDSSNIDYGYNFYVNYQNQNTFYEDVQFGEYRRDPDSSVTSLFPNRKSSGQMGENNVIWSALLGQSLKINKVHKISLNLFHTQNGKSQAADLFEQNFETNPAFLTKQSLQYTQRSVTNINLSGKHNLKKNKWEAKWAVSPSISRITDPDIRSTILEKEEDNDGNYFYSLNQSVGGEIKRIWRDLSEYNVNAKVDFQYSYKRLPKNATDSLDSKIKFGAYEVFKSRSFQVLNYVFNVEGNNEILESDPNHYFEDENIWTVQTDEGTYADGERELANTFDASQFIFAAYGMHELPITSKFNAVYGVRMEKVTNKYTGQNTSGTINYNDTTVLDNLNFLPAVNLVYKLKDTLFTKMNLRSSYSQTLARPSFKEKSIAQIYDPIQGRRFNGNIDLLQTNIHNADVRWEYLYGRTEILSVSGFYKRFINPIELVSFDIAPNEVQPKNAGVADVYGVELEAKKRIGWTAEGQEHIKFEVGANFTWIESRIDMNKVFIDSLTTEKDVRIENARAGEVISDFRPMFGQSPYLVNGFVSFGNDSTGIGLNLSYNVQGKRLAVIGIGAIPDVYEKPFHSLNFKASKKFGKENQWKGSLAAQNLLNNKRQRFYESYNAKPELYDYFNQGITISASISYTLK